MVVTIASSKEKDFTFKLSKINLLLLELGRLSKILNLDKFQMVRIKTCIYIYYSFSYLDSTSGVP